MIALHAERVAADRRAVRWVMPAGSLPVGRVRRAPGRLREMFDDGTLTAAMTEHTAVWLWVGNPDDWAAIGARVRSALGDALADPGAWVVEPAPGEVLHLVAGDVLDGSVGEFIRSHGGTAVAERVDGGDIVAVRLGGACRNCVAADQTLRLRLTDALRRRCPDLAEVAAADGRIILRLGG